VNTVCSASVSSSHTGHTFFAHSALPPNDISTDTNISGVDGHVAFCLILVVVANISGTFFELIVVEGPEYIAFTFDAIYHSCCVVVDLNAIRANLYSTLWELAANAGR